jgi:hypothetical protein
MVLNFIAGMCALRGLGMAFPLGWNSFVIIAGVFIPVVWPRFIEEGLTTWPYTIIFIWFAIFACELTAFVSSVTHAAIKRGDDQKKED